MGDGACKIAADEGDDMVGNIAGDNCTDAACVCSAVVWECTVHFVDIAVVVFHGIVFLVYVSFVVLHNVQHNGTSVRTGYSHSPWAALLQLNCLCQKIALRATLFVAMREWLL